MTLLRKIATLGAAGKLRPRPDAARLLEVFYSVGTIPRWDDLGGEVWDALGSSKKSLTLELPRELVDRIRATAHGLRLTLAEVAEPALLAEVERLEREQNKGKPFPKLPGPRAGGRPIGS